MSEDENETGWPVEAIPAAASDALRSILEAGECVTHAVAVVGCSLVLTDRHLLVVREGADHRPRSGVQRWPLDRSVTIHTTPVLHGTGRVVIEHDGRTASVFVSSGEWPATDALLMEAHRLIHLAPLPEPPSG